MVGQGEFRILVFCHLPCTPLTCGFKFPVMITFFPLSTTKSVTEKFPYSPFTRHFPGHLFLEVVIFKTFCDHLSPEFPPCSDSGPSETIKTPISQGSHWSQYWLMWAFLPSQAIPYSIATLPMHVKRYTTHKHTYSSISKSFILEGDFGIFFSPRKYVDRFPKKICWQVNITLKFQNH